MDRILLDQAIRALSIQTVLLRSSSVRAHDALLPPADHSLSLIVKHQAGPTGEFQAAEIEDKEGRTENVIVFYFHAAVRLVDQLAAAESQVNENSNRGDSAANEGTVRLEIVAEFGAHYRLGADIDIQSIRSALEEFGNCNVGLHIWPYWREYVHSTCARLGVPTIPIPMYKIPPMTSGK